MRATPAVIHLRRVSQKRGVPVVACTSAPIVAGTRFQFANFPAGATCPRCLAYAKRAEAREVRRPAVAV